MATIDDVNLSAVFRHLGLRGAMDESSWMRAEKTWIDERPMPTSEQCLAVWPEVEQALAARIAEIEARRSNAL